jgi:excisionase family DNA binding protein
MNVESEPTFLNVRETAKRLGVHENTIRNWARDGTLTSARLPGTRSHRFDERDVDRLRRQRGQVVSTIEPERRTIGPELIDASEHVRHHETHKEPFPSSCVACWRRRRA